MTVEHKVGQMIQAEIANATPDDARAFGLGAILNGGGSFPGGDKHANVDDWLALADAYFAASRTGREPDLAIPILWGTDAVHGHSNVFRATVFPHNIGLGAAHGGDLIRAIGEATAREVTATGTSHPRRVPAPATRPYSIEHRRLARRAVRESLVMLKNDNALLPLRRDLNVLLAGDGAHDIGKQCGGWTLTWQGTDNHNEDFPDGTSIFEGIADVVSGNGSTVLRPDGEFAEGETPDVAIVVFGEDPYAEGDGDRSHLGYSAEHPEPLAILCRLKTRGVPTVAVLLTGRPLWMNPELNAADAFVVAWLPGTEGGGVADVLFRNAQGTVDHDFRGTLSFSWPRHALHNPLNVGDPDYDPLFPFGFGLRYADPVKRVPRLDEEDVARHVPVHEIPRRATSHYPR